MFTWVLRWKPPLSMENLVQQQRRTSTHRYSADAHGKTLLFMPQLVVLDSRRPWFFMHAFTSVHLPWKLNRQFVTDPVAKLWTDQVGELDWAVGVLMDQLAATGQEDNTVVVLTADNGPYLEFASSDCPQNCRLQNHSAGAPEGFGCSPCNPAVVSHAGPLSGGKGQTWEGGVRVPGIWRWPGKIPAGTVNPTVAGSLDFLPTAVALANGKLDDTITLDGRDLSATLLAPSARGLIQSEPDGSFVYWCGVNIMAVRLGRYKVVWLAQKWVGGDLHTETKSSLCAGTGKCCAGSPTRLCTCSANHEFTDQTKYPDMNGKPVVFDLVKTPEEDLDMREDSLSESVQSIIDQGEGVRLEKLRSVAKDRGLLPSGSVEAMEKQLIMAPDLMSVDFCVDAPHPIVLPGRTVPVCPAPFSPPAQQIKKFQPYENCVTPGPSDACRKRYPCCQQEGYEGPFEYVVKYDNGTVNQCGCFKQPTGSSLFPETRLLNSSSVRRWQLLAEHGNVWRAASEGTCWAANESAANLKRCDSIARWGLNNLPTGWLWNEAYVPDAWNPQDIMAGAAAAEPLEFTI
mmetsp:Transcript_145424/g.465984  ORF Transcript_145424/g.465984 Transcript_145424/m.465984 type:complete len:570 (-) Transcript_145424:83-1792(-)